MPKIFISYRHADNQHITDCLYDYLEDAFGHKNGVQDMEKSRHPDFKCNGWLMESDHSL